MALVPARANIQISGISQWGISDTTASDTGYSAIPFPRNTKFELKTLETKNSLGQPVPYAYELIGSAEFPALRTTANFVKLLDTLGTDLIEHRITFINGQIVSSKPGVSTPSPTGFGTKWKLVSDKDMDGDMFIEMSISRRLTVAEYTQILTSANAPTFGTSATFTNITSLARTDIVPAGISKVEVGVSYADDIDNLRSGKFYAELLCTKDSHGQDVGYAIKIDYECESMETIEAELLKWDDIVTAATSCRITFANGLVCTMPTQVGITTSLQIIKDSDDIAFLKVAGSGIILKSAWDGLWGA